MFKKSLALTSLIIGVFIVVIYHFPFFKYCLQEIDFSTSSGIVLMINLVVLLVVMNTLATYLVLYVFRGAGKYIIALSLIINAIALYFINTYNILIDITMIGNVLNTNVDEATSYFSLPFIGYVLLLGVLPAVLLFKFHPLKETLKQFALKLTITLVVMAGFAYVNSSSWLWVDKNVPTLGSLAMPWCYVVNVIRYANEQHKQNKTEELLPDLKIRNDKKSVVVLVIGESTRKQNFSLYGYPKETNPMLKQVSDLHVYNAESDDTYTIAGVKAILDFEDTRDFVEPLPSYLHRNGIYVEWRTSNSGEPNLKVTKRLSSESLHDLAVREGLSAEHDEVLLAGILDAIKNCNNSKVFITLHTSTSHGPTYFKKYPERFGKFQPVCTGVELSKYSQEELINAYDNTILYTDYLLATLIEQLSTLEDYSSTMLFVSDHGESLGEKGFYMHGIPKRMAPEEQYEIPFLVWSNDASLHFKTKEMITQHHVFHTIMDALGLDSEIYNSEMSLIER